MINRIKLFLVFFISTVLTHSSFGQEVEESSDRRGEENKHQIALVFGLSHVPAAFEEGEFTKEIYLPTIGFDYYYKLNEKWKLVFVLDLEIGKYQVDYRGENIKREGALITGIGVGYEILSGWSVGVGPGVEFERNKNIFIVRFNTDYEFELGNDFGLAPYFSYDFKLEYDTFSLGIGIHKSF